MLRPTLLLLLPLLLFGRVQQATAQVADNAPPLKGRVLDANTRLPVPYASLTLRHDFEWTLANANGHFQLAAPKNSAPDTLLVECPGYQTQAVVLRNPTLADTTFTLEKIAPTPQVQPIQSASVEIKQLGSLAKQPGAGMIQGLRGAQYAFLIEPSSKQQLGSVRTVSFFIGENGFPKNSFRIRLYRADGPNHSPSTNLLNKNLIVAAPMGGQWFTVDIAKYLVEAPHEGFFVAMEWVFDLGVDEHGMILSQSIRPTFDFKNSRTWSFTIGKGWSLLTLKLPDGKFYNAKIRTEIEASK